MIRNSASFLSFDIAALPPRVFGCLILSVVWRTNDDHDQVSFCMPLLWWLLPSS